MTNVNINLLIPFLLLRILPEVRKWGFEDASADAVGVRYIVPFLLTSVKELEEIGPVGNVGLNIEDIVPAGCEAIEVGRCAEVADNHFSTEVGGLLGECETNA
jgi:hypothetical protein